MSLPFFLCTGGSNPIPVSRFVLSTGLRHECLKKNKESEQRRLTNMLEAYNLFENYFSYFKYVLFNSQILYLKDL